jgi:hypothetical protein
MVRPRIVLTAVAIDRYAGVPGRFSLGGPDGCGLTLVRSIRARSHDDAANGRSAAE